MRKTFILAAAALALGLAGQAQAGWNNGVSLNGLDSTNGISLNGLSSGNGVSLNGLGINGMGLNGLSINGMGATNGSLPGGRADIAIQGVTLPGGETIHSIIMPD